MFNPAEVVLSSAESIFSYLSSAILHTRRPEGVDWTQRKVASCCYYEPTPSAEEATRKLPLNQFSEHHGWGDAAPPPSAPSNSAASPG